MHLSTYWNPEVSCVGARVFVICLRCFISVMLSCQFLFNGVHSWFSCFFAFCHMAGTKVLKKTVKQVRTQGGTAVCACASVHIRVNMHGPVCASLATDEFGTGLACQRFITELRGRAFMTARPPRSGNRQS